ncbi:MAG: M48 family metalloprotease [Actinobacteria bacterium]|nr:M48 family metalloprotease [Actinomycetota bacterium]
MSAVATTAVVILCAVTGFWFLGQGRLALSSSGAVPVRGGDHPRLENLVRGLADDLGVETPSLWLIPSGEPNALVTRWPSPIIAVSRGLLETYNRTELEAVIAHCLVRVGDKTTMRRSSIAVALRSQGGVEVGGLDDRAAASVTHYPPALAAAIDKAHPAAERFAPFWFVARGRCHRDPDSRVAEILDL